MNQKISSGKKMKLLSYAIKGSGVAIIIIAIVVVLSFRAKKEIEEYTIKNEKLYIYFGNQKLEYDSKITLNRNNDITKILTDEKEMDLDSEPIYYYDSKKIILPSNMLIAFPLNGVLQKKVSYYTIISNNAGQIHAKNHNLDKVVDDAVLFDGDDLYVFTSEVEIAFGSEKVKISPLSFVLCNYKGDLYIYNYENDSMKTYENVKDIVYARNNKYEINLSVDSVTFNDKNVLLTKNFESLELLK